jgi:hypothetical protein
MIRLLTIEDFPAALEMIDLKPRTSGTVPVTKDEFIENFTHYFLGSEDSCALGYFENDELFCFVCMGFFESKLRGKFWVIPGLYTKKFKQVFSFKDTDMAHLFRAAFELAENRGYYEFYYSVAERVMNAYERQWQRNSIMETGRYDLILLDTVPSYTQPEQEIYWRLMGRSIKPDTIVIKKRVLRDEFRDKLVLYSPLDVPKIEPNNWDEWWEIWNTYSAVATKKIITHNPHKSVWKSLELYRYTESSPVIDNIVYECPRCPDSPVIQDLVRQIKEALPGIVRYIRVIENQSFILFHTDNSEPYFQFRTLMWTTNNKLNWLLRRKNEVRRPELPPESNTFFYYDFHTQHCAPYLPHISKGIIQVFIDPAPELNRLINKSSRKYEGLAWVVDR